MGTELMEQQEELDKEFQEDSKVIGNEVYGFLSLVYPAYLVDQSDIERHLDPDSSAQLESMTFFRIGSCTADNVEKGFENVNERFEKLFTAFYSIKIPIAYGLISSDGKTSLVIGVYNRTDVESVKVIAQGMLSGIELEATKIDFHVHSGKKMSQGILAGVPSLYVKDEKQKFSLSSIMRSLNGQNYTLLFVAKPVPQENISQEISELITIRDKAFAVSKRNIARTNGYSETKTTGKNVADGEVRENPGGLVGDVAGQAVGAAIGAKAGVAVGNFIPRIGKVTGLALGTGIGAGIGGGLGTLIGTLAGKGHTHSEGYSESISEAISESESISSEMQNGFAIELMNFADTAIERLKSGQNNGFWQTAIAYSAETELARNVIRACLGAELSKVDSEKLPMIAFEPEASNKDVLRIPNFLEQGMELNPLCSYINSAELGLMCTVPTESVPDFELRLERKFPLVASEPVGGNNIEIGNVVDGKRSLGNMPFALSELDLNKHTFVCDITGSGKTTTVKKMLSEAKKPFLVIESAKKEYRNMDCEKEVYTLGKPEIHAPQMNPFYIMPGVSPQVHIDFLKDLFNASFSFYGPMPYILEKCLHTVYRNKGWNLTYGYHPLLADGKNLSNLFDISHMKKQYGKCRRGFEIRWRSGGKCQDGHESKAGESLRWGKGIYLQHE